MSLHNVDYNYIKCDRYDCGKRLEPVDVLKGFSLKNEIDARFLAAHGWVYFKDRHFCSEYCKNRTLDYIRLYPDYHLAKDKKLEKKERYKKFYDLIKKQLSFSKDMCNSFPFLILGGCDLFAKTILNDIRTNDCIESFGK